MVAAAAYPGQQRRDHGRAGSPTDAKGHELQFGTNFLGHFALTSGLRSALAAASGSRVVSVSSNGHFFSPVIFDDPDYLARPYDPWSAYGPSKTADVLLAVEVTRRWSNLGIYANALNPGAIATNLQKYTGGIQTPVEKRKTPAQGAATSVLLAASPLLDGLGGRYFEKCNEGRVLDENEEPEMFGGGVAPWAVDPGNAERLWAMATAFIGGKVRALPRLTEDKIHPCRGAGTGQAASARVASNMLGSNRSQPDESLRWLPRLGH